MDSELLTKAMLKEDLKEFKSWLKRKLIIGAAIIIVTFILTLYFMLDYSLSGVRP